MNILLVDDERLAVEVMNRMIDKEKYGFSTIYKALSMKQARRRILILLSVISRCRVEVGWILCSGFWIQVEIRLLFSLPVMRFFRMHSRQFP